MIFLLFSLLLHIFNQSAFSHWFWGPEFGVTRLNFKFGQLNPKTGTSGSQIRGTLIFQLFFFFSRLRSCFDQLPFQHRFLAPKIGVTRLNLEFGPLNPKTGTSGSQIEGALIFRLFCFFRFCGDFRPVSVLTLVFGPKNRWHEVKL